MISPGNRPKGILKSNGHSKPIKVIAKPETIRIFCMENFNLDFS